MCLTESAIALGLGCKVRLPSSSSSATRAARLYGEEPSRIVISLSKEDVQKARATAEANHTRFEVIGEVGGNAVHIDGCLEVRVKDLADAHHRCLESIVGV